MARRREPARFSIRGPYNIVDEITDVRYTDQAALSKAISAALKSPSPGTWEVIEWDDVVYRVTRDDQRSVRIEVGA